MIIILDAIRRRAMSRAERVLHVSTPGSPDRFPDSSLAIGHVGKDKWVRRVRPIQMAELSLTVTTPVTPAELDQREGEMLWNNWKHEFETEKRELDGPLTRKKKTYP